MPISTAKAPFATSSGLPSPNPRDPPAKAPTNAISAKRSLGPRPSYGPLYQRRSVRGKPGGGGGGRGGGRRPGERGAGGGDSGQGGEEGRGGEGGRRCGAGGGLSKMRRWLGGKHNARVRARQASSSKLSRPISVSEFAQLRQQGWLGFCP